MRNINPPSLADRVLRFFLKEELAEEVTGDLLEQFQFDQRRYGTPGARFHYWYQVFNYCRPFALKKLSIGQKINMAMWQHNVKIGWRSLKKNKYISLIHIGGLSLGMAIVILTGLWIWDEVKYDRFHDHYHETYQVIAHRDFNGNIFTDRNMVFPLANNMVDRVGQLKKVSWTTHRQTNLFSKGVKSIQLQGHDVGGPYFEMFSWQFIHGTAETAFAQASNLVLTESAALQFFGHSNVVGETLKFNNGDDLMVSGVLRDPPSQSTLSFDYLRPFNFSDPGIQRLQDHWNNYGWMVYFQTFPDADLDKINSGITQIMTEKTENAGSDYFGFPMSRWHLYSEFKDGINTGGQIRYVRLFGLVAIIIILIACINFMNLSTARAQDRSREIAVRKTLGSQRAQLARQFIAEAMVLVSVSFVVAIILVIVLLPFFNQFLNKQMGIEWSSPAFWILSLLFILVIGLLAGSYPALYLSSLRPIAIINDIFLRTGNQLPRKVLVVLQFVASIGLVSSTIYIYQQIQFVKDRDLGYNTDQLLMIPASGKINEEYQVLRDELLSSSYVAAMTRNRSPITDIWWKSPAPDWPGREPGSDILFTGQTTGVGYSETFGIDILQGRDFTGSVSDTAAVLLNQAAIDAMQLEDPIGKQINYVGDNYAIIGVTENVVMESPFSSVEPQMIYYSDNYGSYVHVRLNQGVDLENALTYLEETFQSVNPGFPFEYQFADEEFDQKFSRESMLNKLINILAIVAIFICCLGLVGLVIFALEKRRKELAIRTVLGARISQLLLLVSREFLLLVGASFVVAVPLTYFYIQNWLSGFDYRIKIDPELFLIPGMLTLILTLLIVGVSVMANARKNPMNALKED